MKNQFILGIIVSFIIVIAVLSRTLFYSDIQDMLPQLEDNESVLPVINQEESSLLAPANTDILSFDLGEMTIADKTNMIQIPLKGRLVVPKDEGEYPIVFIVPDLSLESDVSVAYDAILTEMGNLNYLGIYLDLTKIKDIEGFKDEMLTLVFNEYRERLSHSLVGEGTDFGINLSNKGSLSKVVMVGHGDSTRKLYDIVLDQEYRQQLNVVGMLLIEPIEVNYQDLSYPDIPTAIMLSEENQDKQSIGRTLYEDYRKEKARKTLTSLIYVKSGKFDDFNYSGLESALSFEDNIQFISKYTIDFLDSIFNHQPMGIGFSVLELSPKELYKTEVRTSLSVPNTLMLMNAAIEMNPTINTLGGNVVANNLEIESVKDGIDSFLIQWNDVNASLEIELPIGNQDLSHYDAISLYLSNDEIQEDMSSPSLIIELIDETDKSAQVKIDSIEKLLVAGTQESIFYNERVLLNQFESVNLKAIKKINLLFDESSSGCIRLGDLSLIKSPN